MSKGDVMKRILSLFLAFILLFLVGCNSFAPKEYPEPVVVLPNENMAETINGYKTQNTISSEKVEQNSSKPQASSLNSQNDTLSFCGNKNTKKFHKADCRYAKNLAADRRVNFASESEALENGYSACKVCFKE